MGLFRYIVVMGVVAGFCCSALGEPRTWTNRNGKTAVAEFQALENGTLVLKKGSKTIRVPLENFSEEDQAYVRLQLEELKAGQDRLALERRDKLQTLLGLNTGVSIAERRWDDWRDYYTESLCGKKMMEFFENERSIVDERSKGVFVSAEHAVRPPDYEPVMATYCPSDYDGMEKLGVYIHISPGDDAAVLSADYQEILGKHRLVYASPKGAGNDKADMRRCALALDALAQLRKDYKIDENRIYIGGTSGGGAESTFATFLYPQDFRASLNSVRSFSLTSSGCLPFADQSDIRKASKNQQPFAFISGPDDFNYKHMPRTEQSFRDHHFVVRFFDIPGMGHENVSPETLNLVLEWVEANNPRL